MKAKEIENYYNKYKLPSARINDIKMTGKVGARGCDLLHSLHYN